MVERDALSELESLEKIQKIIDVDLSEIFSGDFQKIDGFDLGLSLIFGGAFVGFVSILIFVGLLEMNFISKDQGIFVFLLSEFIFVNFVLYMKRRANKKADKCSEDLLEEVQKKYFLEDVENIWQYNKKIKSLRENTLNSLSYNEGFVKTCLSELKKENPKFVNNKNIILKIAKPMTEQALKEKDYKEVLEKMHKVIVEDSDIMDIKEKSNNFKIVEID